MSDYTPSLGRVRTVYMDHRLDCLFADCTESMAQAEFDRAIAKIRADAKAEALREAAAIVASEEAKQWRDDRGGGVYGVRVPGSQIVAQRMQVVGKIITNRADNLEAPNASDS